MPIRILHFPFPAFHAIHCSFSPQQTECPAAGSKPAGANAAANGTAHAANPNSVVATLPQPSPSPTPPTSKSQASRSRSSKRPCSQPFLFPPWTQQNATPFYFTTPTQFAPATFIGSCPTLQQPTHRGPPLSPTRVPRPHPVPRLCITIYLSFLFSLQPSKSPVADLVSMRASYWHRLKWLRLLSSR